MSESLEDIQKMANEIAETSKSVTGIFSKHENIRKNLRRLSSLYAKTIFDCCPKSIYVELSEAVIGEISDDKYLNIAFSVECAESMDEGNARTFATQLFKELESNKGILNFKFIPDEAPLISESGAYGNVFVNGIARGLVDVNGNETLAGVLRVQYHFEPITYEEIEESVEEIIKETQEKITNG